MRAKNMLPGSYFNAVNKPFPLGRSVGRKVWSQSPTMSRYVLLEKVVPHVRISPTNSSHWDFPNDQNKDTEDVGDVYIAADHL